MSTSGASCGPVHEIVEGQLIAIGAKLLADVDDFRSGPDSFENFHDNAICGKQARRAQAQRHFIDIDESASAWPVSICRSKRVMESAMTLEEALAKG